MEPISLPRIDGDRLVFDGIRRAWVARSRIRARGDAERPSRAQVEGVRIRAGWLGRNFMLDSMQIFGCPFDQLSKYAISMLIEIYAWAYLSPEVRKFYEGSRARSTTAS